MAGADSLAVQQWKWAAIEEQQSYMELLKARKTDVVASSQLPRVVGFGMFGPPAQLPDASNEHAGYDGVQLKHIRKVCTAILRCGRKFRHDEEDPKEVRLKFLFVVTRSSRERTATYPVFHLQDGERQFVDWQARVYGSWKKFLKHNKLPGCRMCYPEDGEYSETELGAVRVGFRRSPASNNAKAALTAFSLVVSLASTAVSVASLLVPVAPSLLVAAAVGAIASGTYSVASSVESLCDRRRHGKTLSLRSGDARRCWLALGAGTAGLAVSGAGQLASRGCRALAALASVSSTARGLSLANNAVDLMKKMWAGKTLSAIDAFQVASFLLFFTGTALSSAQAAARLRSLPTDKTAGRKKKKGEENKDEENKDEEKEDEVEKDEEKKDEEKKDEVEKDEEKKDEEKQDEKKEHLESREDHNYERADKQPLRSGPSPASPTWVVHPQADTKVQLAEGADVGDDEVDAMLRLLKEEGRGRPYIADDDADLNKFWKRICTVMLVSSLVTVIVIARTLLAQ